MAAGAAAYGSTVLVGVAVAIELAVSGTVPLLPALVAVGGGHALTGIGEGVVTVAILGMVTRARPELVRARRASPLARSLAGTAAAAAVALAVTAAFFASAKPDVLERAIEQLGIDAAAVASWSAPLADYSAPLGGALAAAIIGVVVVFVVAWAVGRAFGHSGREAL